ncbi:hypothetical protein SDC9_188043 [bioreactor metagenome]|uniref:Uncharacterized protein n=1 Tax=bioreactor metagenome TaxID=1076179 RepID=A0A645HN77_9ZZZZ
MALPESGNHDLAALLQIDLLNSGLQLLGGGLDGQGDHALFQFLHALDIHVCYFLLSAQAPPSLGRQRPFTKSYLLYQS